MPWLVAADPPTQADITWHVGHARTLYLGSLICQSLDVPLDIRLQGGRIDIPARIDVSGAVIDLANCINFLGPVFRRLYWQPHRPPEEWEVRAELGERAEQFLNAMNAMKASVNSTNAASRCEDIITHYPSLAIRAVEWVDPHQWIDQPNSAAAIENILIYEKLLYDIAGRTRNERSLPLITLGGSKLAKSEGRMIHWGVLRCVSREVARQFLLATAIRPEDPLAIMDDELSIDQMVLDPYEWSWGVWAELIRR